MDLDFEIINEFLEKDDNGNLALSERGLPILKQGPVDPDLRSLILSGKLDNIEKFAKIKIDKEQFDWAEECYNILVKYLRIIFDGEISEKKPHLPKRPKVKKVDDVLKPYLGCIFKVQRSRKVATAIIKTSTGKAFDADEQSIIRLGNAVIKLSDAPDDHEIPWSTDDVPTGVMVPCTKAEIVEAHKLATDNFAEVWELK